MVSWNLAVDLGNMNAFFTVKGGGKLSGDFIVFWKDKKSELLELPVYSDT